jgi:signal transduction histidine kinase
MGANFRLLVLAAAVLLAGGVLVAWLRGHDDQDAKAPRGRLHMLGRPLAIALLTLSVVTVLSAAGSHEHSKQALLLIIAIAVALVLALRPRIVARLIPVALILVGLAGLVLARNYVGLHDGSIAATPGPSFALTPAALQKADGYSPQNLSGTDSFVLPLAYLFLLLGGWLAWRSADPVLATGRRLLGPVSGLAPRAQLRALLILPVAVMAAELFIPGRLQSVGPAALWFALFLSAAVAVLRGWPGAAARLAVLGVFLLGLSGIVAAMTFQYGFTPSEYGLVVLADRSSPALVVAQALVLLAFGAWLAPQTFPSARRLLRLPPDPELTRQVQQLTESRAVVVDTAASDLRRLERDLHDGAQARLVALGMNLRAAERLIPVNPDAALALVAEARDASVRALTELRELVRGVHPPVLADRGLADAVRALALDCPLATQTDIDLPGRLPAPVETACYFAVAELLTNAAKHSGARDARIDVRHADGMLRIDVTDFGLGGADPAAGGGLAGVEKRLAAFDGIMAISSPAGGPTIVVLEVPCALSSPKTSSCC